MPVILDPEDYDGWLSNEGTPEDKARTNQLTIPYDEHKMSFKTVPKLAGKFGVGNTSEARKYEHYEELEEVEWISTILQDKNIE